MAVTQEHKIGRRSSIIMEVMQSCQEELAIELRCEGKEGVTGERRGGESGLSKRTEIVKRRASTWPKNATLKFCTKYAAHKMRIF